MGGGQALELAVNHPERLRSVVAISASVRPTGSSTPIGPTSTLNINGPDRIVAASNILSDATGSVTVHNQSATNLVYDVTGFFT
jgi:pimeloyl-ACP methyl ester carboxylesterase